MPETEDSVVETAPVPPTQDNNDGPKTTTLATLRGEGAAMALAPDQRAGFTTAGSFELLQRGAKMLAQSDLLPKIYRNNIPNCGIALEMAQRLGASPLMVAQNMDIVHGRPTWRATFIIACINQCGRFSPLRYKWTGKPGEDTWGCVASAVDLKTGAELDGPLVTIGIAKVEGWYGREGSKWKTIPQLMLMYRAAAWFGRTYAPELTMGLQSREEAEDIIEMDRTAPGEYSLADLQKAVELPTGDKVNPQTGEVVEEKAAEKKAPEPPTTTSTETKTANGKSRFAANKRPF